MNARKLVIGDLIRDRNDVGFISIMQPVHFLDAVDESKSVFVVLGVSFVQRASRCAMYYLYVLSGSTPYRTTVPITLEDLERFEVLSSVADRGAD